MNTKEFISKANIATLYKKINKNHKFGSTKKEKKKIIDKLMSNMKAVYKSLDQNKINQRNYQNIFDQFNKISMEETIKELNNKKESSSKKVVRKKSSQMSQVDINKNKYERDFNSVPQRQIQVLSRPQQTSNITNLNNSDNYVVPKNKFGAINNNSLKNTIEDKQSIDRMFQPIRTNDDKMFNNMSNSRNMNDMNSALKEIENQRKINSNEIRPPTPEFLKTKQVGSSSKEINNNFNSNNIPKNIINDFEVNDGSYSSINASEPINTKKFVENNLSFEERLQQLQSSRGENIEINQQNPSQFQQKMEEINSNVNLKNVNSNTINDNNLNYQSQVAQMRNSVQDDTSYQNQMRNSAQNEMSYQNQMEQMRNSVQDDTSYQNQMRNSAQNEMNYQNQMEQMRNSIQDDTSYQNQMRNSAQNEMSYQNQMRNSGQNEMSYQNQMRNSAQNEMSYQNQMEEMRNTVQNNNSYSSSNIINQLKDRIVQLESENKKLNDSTNYVEQLIKNINQLKIENRDLKNRDHLYQLNSGILNQREQSLTDREIELNKLLTMYHDINNKKNIQLEVISDGKSEYKYNFENIEGVLGLKLISYSLPNPRFNINKNNCIFKYSINDVDKEINIPTGLYNIDKLIEILNNNDDFSLIKSNDQNLKIESEQDIELDNSHLITKNLGFNNELFGKNIIASNTWDLRLPDKLFLYIKNINDGPIGILYFNEIFSSEILFEEPINLNHLDISLLDENGLLHDFSNLHYSLSFKLDVQIQKIEALHRNIIIFGIKKIYN